MTTTQTLSYRKTQQGEWVVFGPAALIHPGQTVTVTTKAGVTKTERIERTGRTFGDGLCYGYIAKSAAQSVHSHRRGNEIDRCYYGHSFPQRGCTSCFDTFDI